MPDAVLIGGANGAGKTTFARNLVPEAYPGALFLNADEIQRESVSLSSPLAAGRALLGRLDAVLAAGGDFVLETTLSSAAYARAFPAWRARDYRVSLHFLEVASADVAVRRVALRVARGGHAIPEGDVRRRHARGLRLFADVYRPAADVWYRYRVDEGGPTLVDQGAIQR